jgi:hypothetical protein
MTMAILENKFGSVDGLNDDRCEPNQVPRRDQGDDASSGWGYSDVGV